MDWQPIETGPRDGQLVDLWVVDSDGVGERVPDAWWGKFTVWDQYPFKSHEEDGWTFQDWHPDWGMCHNPVESGKAGNRATHWMPRPEAPASCDTHRNGQDAEERLGS